MLVQAFAPQVIPLSQYRGQREKKNHMSPCRVTLVQIMCTQGLSSRQNWLSDKKAELETASSGPKGIVILLSCLMHDEIDRFTIYATG